MILLFFTVIGGSSFFPNTVSAEDKKASILELNIRPQKIKGESSSDTFKYQVLKLVLRKTQKKFGDFVLKEYKNQIKQSRVISLIKKGETFRVIATMTSLAREQELWPIRIPLYRGLLGHRIFIIREEDQPIFSAMTTLDELKKLTAIQGHDWPDSDILESNGFKLYRSANFRGIFQMLRLNRGDYFPRGIHEPWLELKKHKDKNLAIEKTLLLHYIAPFYFFVRYGDHELHDRIKEGLLIAMKDGSFAALFFNHPDMQNIFEQAMIGKRKIFQIKNPVLSKETPLDKPKLWYRVGDEKRYFSKNKAD